MNPAEPACRYDDGSPVITPRLRAVLSPLELMLYSSGSLAVFLVHRLYPDIHDTLIDSWSLDDFVAYGLEKAVQHDTLNKPAVLHWTRQELWKRTKRQKRYFLVKDLWIEESIAPEEVPEELPAEVIQWLELNLPPDVTEGLVLVAEQDWTLDEVCEKLGLDITVLSRSLRRLRALIKEENSGED